MSLKDEVPKIMPVHKKTRADKQTWFKAFVAPGEYDSQVSLDVKCSKGVTTAIRRVIILAKFPIVPV